MKVQELFEGYPGGYRLKPGYSDDSKHVVGAAADWLKMLQVEPADLAEAIKQLKSSSSFKKLAEKFDYIGTAKMEKNGTLRFRSKDNEARNYLIYANGQIRSEKADRRASAVDHQIGKMVTPKPHAVPGDPIKTMVRLYTVAMEALGKKKLKS